MTKSDNTVEKKQSALQNALTHFKSKLAGELKKIAVPEWNIDVYYRGTSSMATEAKILSLTTSGKTAEGLVESIVQKAMDEDGKRLFKDTDRATLMHEADPQVLIKVATALNNATSEDSIADIEGN